MMIAVFDREENNSGKGENVSKAFFLKVLKRQDCVDSEQTQPSATSTNSSSPPSSKLPSNQTRLVHTSCPLATCPVVISSLL